MLTVFGIRHHGPGSASTLREALKQLVPDCILIEGPQDAEGALKYIADPTLQPPVAILQYHTKNLKQAAYIPFANFSPEWQAAKYGIKQNIPVKFMDLPMSVTFALDENEAQRIQLKMVEDGPKVDAALLRDPLGYMARLAGYSDSERWWESMFEQAENDTLIFEHILEMMTLLRAELKGKDRPRTLLREAFMRKTIRQTIKEGYQNIAVVCGAWHAPVLHNYLDYKQAADNALLKGLKKKKTVATWIPWTYQRLAFQSGYGAGVLSPAWYNLLFNHSEEVNIRWMIEVARLLREENLDASAAHVMEGVRLAESLAALRQLKIAGIAELEEAATSVFAEGRKEAIDLIRNKLIIGEVMGNVPHNIPQIPLQQDLEKTIKTARLSKERKSLSPTERKLDLRKETNLIASHLLHRLRLLNINWGKEMAVSERNTGSFSEIWQLCWDPEFEIRIIEAGMWGNTVGEAATNYVIQQASKKEKLVELTTLAGRVLKADLPQAIEPLIERLQEVSAIDRDTFHLMEALLPLVQVVRYGSSRQMDVSALLILIDQLIPKICIGIPNAARQIESEVAAELFQKLIACNSAISLLGEEKYEEAWFQALNQLVTVPGVHRLIVGVATRILFDKSILSIEQVTIAMQYSLSPSNTTIDAAEWLEGFLFGSGLLLIYNPLLWSILDQWVEQLDEETFKEILPLLRRTFSKFADAERQKMLYLAQHGPESKAQVSTKMEWEENRSATILPTLKLLLDL